MRAGGRLINGVAKTIKGIFVIFLIAFVAFVVAALVHDGDTLVSDIIGSPARTFHQWVADHAAAFLEGPASDEV